MADADSIGLKTCIRCKVSQARTEFYRYARSADKLAYECRTCQKERAVAWQKANPAKKAAHDRKQDQKPERKAKHNARTRAAYKADPTKTLQRGAEWARLNPERVAERSARHRNSNPEAVAAAQKRYHDTEVYKHVHRLRSQVQRSILKAEALGLDNSDAITRAQWQQVIDSFGRACCFCLRPEPLSIEHLTPLIRGGTNAVGNIAPACIPCNRKKWKRTLEEFAPDRAEEIRRTASLYG